MQKKIFVQKNHSSGGGNRSSAKFLLWAAVGLIILVLIAPLFHRHSKEGSRDAARRLDSEKGMVVKEIPRSLELLQPNGPQKEEPATEPPKTVGSASPQGLTPTSPAPSPAPVATGQSPSSDTKPSTSVAQDVDKTRPWMEMPKNPSPEAPLAKESVPSPVVPSPPPVAKEVETLSPGEKTQPPVATKATAPPAMSPADLKNKKSPVLAEPKKVVKATSPGMASLPNETAAPAKLSPANEASRSYTVQVGSFKDKQNAEEMRQSLQKKGYQVLLKPTTHPKLGTIYVVQLAPVGSVSKASTLVEQIKNEEKVKPTIIKAPQNP